jgi:hypothetical protein
MDLGRMPLFRRSRLAALVNSEHFRAASAGHISAGQRIRITGLAVVIWAEPRQRVWNGPPQVPDAALSRTASDENNQRSPQPRQGRTLELRWPR